MSMNNNQRASLGNTALSAFVNEAGDAGDEETNLSDLAADLMHLCDGQGIEWAEVLRQANNHYEAETEIGDEAGPKASSDWAEDKAEDDDEDEPDACENCGNTDNDGSDICPDCGGEMG